MTLGKKCAQPYVNLTRTDLKEAIRRVQEDFAFVGLTEYFVESVCLFHRMFGGAINIDELKNMRFGEWLCNLMIKITIPPLPDPPTNI